MGSGGRSTAPKAAGHVVQRPPTDKPPFTLSQIRKAIPPHCFERSVLKSSYYLVHDLVIVAALLYVAMAVIPALPAGLPRVAAWTLYGIAQGCVGGALWVLAHECGHHAFSDYQVLDDFLGLVLHSLLLVPYFSWKFSHRRHHSNTASLERDEVFVPQQKDALPWYATMVRNPVGRLLSIALLLAIAWPLYLTFNAKGRAYPRWANHFNPYGPIFSERERVFVFISDIALLAVCFSLFKLASAFGFWWVVLVYGVPLMVTQSWLVLITYLNHTHLALPRYDSSEWDWMRGALSTMDRDYGIMNYVLHNATDTHVVHHFFPSMPHYHAMEATKAMRPILGEYYKRDPTPIVKAIWREARECIFVEPMEDRKGVLWFSNKL